MKLPLYTALSTHFWGAFLLVCSVVLQACGGVSKGEMNPLGKRSEGATQDLAHIQESGVLIAAMLSGPDAYYEYRDQPMGQQYALIEHFAVAQGVSVRVELAKDTAELLNLLTEGQADIVAVPLPDSLLVANDIQPTATQRQKGAWGIRPDEPLLADALKAWYSDSLLLTAERTSATRGSAKAYVRRHVYAPMLSQSGGVISSYDHLFKQAAMRIGWDWRLVAALCYQESAFDPEAESWAGARGLMQLMPSTARGLGISQSDIYKPEPNIEAGTRLLGQLYQQFSDIGNPAERLKFAIASYNGGAGHVRDAMALARKYGGNPATWDGVSPYILGLSQTQYYRDPVVKYGFMRGEETHDYVYSIMKRWASYGGSAVVGTPTGMPHHTGAAPVGGNTPAIRTHKRNRFSTTNDIKHPEDPDFGGRVNSTEE